MVSETGSVTTVSIRRPVSKKKDRVVKPSEPKDRWPCRRSKGSLKVAAAALRQALQEFILGRQFVTTICAAWSCPRCGNRGTVWPYSRRRIIPRVREQHWTVGGGRCRFRQSSVKIRVLSRPTCWTESVAS